MQAGTIWNNDEFRFFLALPVGNTGEMQTMEAILHTPSTIGGREFDFCEECVWTVVVQWTMRTGSDVVSNNLIMHHTFRRETRQTVSISCIYSPSDSPLSATNISGHSICVQDSTIDFYHEYNWILSI